MIATLIHRAMLVLLAVCACYQLELLFNTEVALVIWAVGMAIVCCVGTFLLAMSTIGEVSWKNRIAAWLIPWGSRLNQGKLWPIPVISWVVWMAIGIATVGLLSPTASEMKSPGTLTRTLLLAAWIVDGGALMYILGTISQHNVLNSSSGRSLWKILAVVVAMIVGSVILHLAGSTQRALYIAGGPPLVLGTCYGLFIVTMLVFGRNARWN